MKIGVALKTGTTAEAEVDPRFGRCGYFLLVDTESDERIVLRNPAVEASGGAGTQAAQWLADQGVEVVIASEFGPKALRALQAGGLQAYSVSGGTGEQAIDQYLQGSLKSVEQPTQRGRGGGGRRRRA
jgi:predicted Fe-Mo cluster-binding NifX family protein